MRIERAEATNFASYRSLAFDFTLDKGVTLVEGKNGSGKSTFCDIIPWCLFGRTAKGGSVDEIRNWSSREPTVGRVLLSLPDGRWEIVRQRGKTNDLYFRREGAEDVSRGKDLTDTQRMLNDKLGIDYDLYMAGGYYHEFSQTAQFFTTTAKNRRLICEQLVDLSLAVKLKEGLKTETKEIKDALSTITMEIRTAEALLVQLNQQADRERNKSAIWNSDKERRLLAAAQNYEAFERNRTRTTHGKRCPTCRTVLGESVHIHDDSPNPYSARIDEIQAETNPYTGEVKSYQADIDSKRAEIESFRGSQQGLLAQQSDLERLDSIVDAYRASSIANTIRFTEQRTNDLLAAHFDAEIRVSFEIAAADKVEVTIFKDGNQASYTQLSKGQRQMLKLCFGVAVMQAVQNQHGITLEQLFFDESTDGLDEGKKLQALHMLETITHGTTYLVEHSGAVRAMANEKYLVELINGESRIGKA